MLNQRPNVTGYRWALVCLVVVVVSLLCRTTWAANVSEWRSRTVFQLLTDRFATDQCWGGVCDDGAYW